MLQKFFKKPRFRSCVLQKPVFCSRPSVLAFFNLNTRKMNANQQQRAQQPPYIGSKISLISKLDIRYEGTLYTVDAIESTIALAKVQSYGTEDRHTPVFVPPRYEVYDFIIFKASDIKDLIVCELPKALGAQSPLVTGLPYDPAIVSISKNPPPEPKLPTKLFDNAIAKNHPPEHKLPAKLFDNDYDFEKANELFREISAELKEKGEKVVVEGTLEKRVFYNKSASFFDNISCDALEKEAGKNVRPDWKRERQTNQETFGHSAVRSLFFQRRGTAGARGGGGHGYGGASTVVPMRFNYRFPNFQQQFQQHRFNNRQQRQTGGNAGFLHY